MFLNSLSPGSRSKSMRVGRGIGSGKGKTSGRGHKGQKSRGGGGGIRKGFEGGQMPLQRRLPKFGFSSRISNFSASVRLSELNNLKGDIISIETLKDAGIINKHIRQVKVFLSGSLDKAVKLEGLTVSAGAAKAINDKGGSIKDIPSKAPSKAAKKPAKSATKLAAKTEYKSEDKQEVKTEDKKEVKDKDKKEVKSEDKKESNMTVKEAKPVEETQGAKATPDSDKKDISDDKDKE